MDHASSSFSLVKRKQTVELTNNSINIESGPSTSSQAQSASSTIPRTSATDTIDPATTASSQQLTQTPSGRRSTQKRSNNSSTVSASDVRHEVSLLVFSLIRLCNDFVYFCLLIFLRCLKNSHVNSLTHATILAI
jgi:hypothetical protein